MKDLIAWFIIGFFALVLLVIFVTILILEPWTVITSFGLVGIMLMVFWALITVF